MNRNRYVEEVAFRQLMNRPISSLATSEIGTHIVNYFTIAIQSQIMRTTWFRGATPDQLTEVREAVRDSLHTAIHHFAHSMGSKASDAYVDLHHMLARGTIGFNKPPRLLNEDGEPALGETPQTETGTDLT